MLKKLKKNDKITRKSLFAETKYGIKTPKFIKEIKQAIKKIVKPIRKS